MDLSSSTLIKSNISTIMQSFPSTPSTFTSESNSTYTTSTTTLFSLVPAPLAPRRHRSNQYLELSDTFANQVTNPVSSPTLTVAKKEEEVFEGNGTLTPNPPRQQNDTAKHRFHSFTIGRYRGRRQLAQRKKKPKQIKERCTFCWHTTQHIKIVGRDARVASYNCWKRLWDLAVCWSCGEMITRTDHEEVVSLGWCLWHRSCFGCLFCRVPMTVPLGIGGVE
jgi:hypothetical protein